MYIHVDKRKLKVSRNLVQSRSRTLSLINLSVSKLKSILNGMIASTFMSY